jgi:hypothetical protein
MPAERPFRLSAVVATLFTTFVAPLTVSVVSSAIKAETTIRVAPAVMPAVPLPERPQPAVILLPPSVTPACTLAAPRPGNAGASARPLTRQSRN